MGGYSRMVCLSVAGMGGSSLGREWGMVCLSVAGMGGSSLGREWLMVEGYTSLWVASCGSVGSDSCLPPTLNGCILELVQLEPWFTSNRILCSVQLVKEG